MSTTALAATGDVESSAVDLFERLARDPNTSVEKIEGLMALWERAEVRKSTGAFNAAMSEAQQKMRPVAADATNPQTRSRYASYEALDLALRPIYTAHGFALSFNTADSGSAESVRVLCEVTHLAGHAKLYHVDMPADGKGAKGGDVMTKTHAVGSALTYGMRYLLKMIFNVAIGDGDGDDDGNKAGAKEQRPEPTGYSDWVEALSDVAEEGLERLQATWKESKRELRDYITTHQPARWQALKAKATKAGAK